jgi:hypothetical protein
MGPLALVVQNRCTRPWSSLPIQVLNQVRAFFSVVWQLKWAMVSTHSSGLIGGFKENPLQI